MKLSLGLGMALLATTTALAHSGGLDRCGGHNDRKRGGYHVHNWTKYCACHPGHANCSTASSAQLRAYSCDNPKLGAKSTCFPPGDPKHMTIALRSKPMAGETTRIKDPGGGVPVEVVDRKTVAGTMWVLVKTADGTVGWIVVAYVRDTDE